MTTHVALLGAGFSRNWNGWLAREVFDALLSDPGIRAEGVLHSRLLTYRSGGRFEEALYDLQLQAATDAEAQRFLNVFEAAIADIFRRMNGAFLELTGFDINNNVGSRVTDFLVKFDAIFSLNQDFLLERHYVTVGNVALTSPQRWGGGACLPGIRAPSGIAPFEHERWLNEKWIVTPPYVVPARTQPIYKLHGSANWADQGNASLLIMGGGKEEAIRAHPLLSWNFDAFRVELVKPDTHLMVIGYGFQDTHINTLLEEGVAAGLRIFIVDPAGIALIDNSDSIGDREGLASAVNGVSTRLLRNTFAEDAAERGRLMDFFRS